MNEEEKTEADRKMEKFNEAMGPMRRTLQVVEKVEFDRCVAGAQDRSLYSRGANH